MQPGYSSLQPGLRTAVMRAVPPYSGARKAEGRERLFSAFYNLGAGQPAFIYTMVHFKEKGIETQSSSNSSEIVASNWQSLRLSGSRTWSPDVVHQHVTFTNVAHSHATCALIAFMFFFRSIYFLSFNEYVLKRNFSITHLTLAVLVFSNTSK